MYTVFLLGRHSKQERKSLCRREFYSSPVSVKNLINPEKTNKKIERIA